MSDKTVAVSAMLVTLPDLRVGVPPDGVVGPPQTRDYLISALCRWCHAPRGRPELVSLFDPLTGSYCVVSCWVNPCGHPDLLEDVISEVWLQCVRYRCVEPAVADFDPHCSAACARADLIVRAEKARERSVALRARQQELRQAAQQRRERGSEL